MNLLRGLAILKAKVLSRKLALSHSGDADGIVSAALYVMSNPSAEIVLAEPWDVDKGLINMVAWDFVADLPCPRKAKLRVDHHATNQPKAKLEYHEVAAPSSAAVALKALNLEDNALAQQLVALANECDTASISSADAWDLNDAVKGGSYRDKVKLAKLLAREGVSALRRSELRELIERNKSRRLATYALADKLPVSQVMVLDMEDGERYSVRGLMVELEKRGAQLTCVITPRRRGFKLHVGARGDSQYDSSQLAAKLGGGGHRWAAGALIKDKERALRTIKEFTGLNELKVLKIAEGNLIQEYVV